MTAARALWITGRNEVELREETLLPPADGEVTVRALYSGISRGTEALVLSGRVPADQRQVMRAPFQAGAFDFPVKYGYAVVGKVEAGPDTLLHKPIFCFHPHQDFFVIPANAVIPLPEGVPPMRAVLAANMETALNIVWDAEILPGDKVAVVGCGVVGALTAWLAARIPGTLVTMIDTNPARASLAAAFGCDFTSPGQIPFDCDRVVHTSATSAGLATAIGTAGTESTIVEASWYGSDLTEIGLGGSFHSKRLRLVSSQVGRVPARQIPRWSTQRRLSTAMSLLRDPKLDILISGETSFENAADHYAEIIHDPATLCHRFRYRTE